MTSPSPFSFGQLWDTVEIQGMPWGGPAGMGAKVEIVGATRFYKIDQKDGQGLDGATQTFRGQKPKPFKIVFSWWTEQQHDYWAFYSAQFNYTASKPGFPPPVYAIYHPKLALLGISAILVESVGAVDVDESTKIAKSVLEVRQFLPATLAPATVTPNAAAPIPPPVIAGTATPSAEQALLQARIYTTQALISGGGLPNAYPHPP